MKISTTLKPLPIHRAAEIPPIASCEALRMDYTIRRIHELVRVWPPSALFWRSMMRANWRLSASKSKSREKDKAVKS